MRLIDADEAKAYLRSSAERFEGSGAYSDGVRNGYNFAASRLGDLKIIDPVKYGKWVADDVLGKIYHCSQCGEGTEYAGGYNYCPHCGAKMNLWDKKMTDAVNQKKLKAYAWDYESRGYTVVVYAETAGKARRMIANENDFRFIDVRV